MTAFWTYDNLARVTGGTWLAPPADCGAVLPAAQRDAGPIIWHDTRDLEPGQCYLAVKGDNFDGHDFVEQAFENGAALALVNSSTAPQAHGLAQKGRGIGAACPILAVPDTVTALQDLARAYRDELARGACKVIGVAGSNGKTTTRHLIHHVLTHAGKNGTQSPKSFNNHLGVPLTLLAARPTDDFVACEIGTNHPGEIDFLSAIARPDIAVITSIGEEHLEFFGSVRGVANEEASILSHVVQGGDCVISDELKEHAPEIVSELTRSDHVHWFGGNGSAYRSGVVIEYDDVSQCQVFRVVGPLLQTNEGQFPPMDGQAGVQFKLHLDGLHNINNAMACIVVARLLDVGVLEIQHSLTTVSPVEGRMQWISFGKGVRVIHDAYNSNPSSIYHALFTALGYEDQRHVVVLGDMLELGQRSEYEHRRVGEYLAKHAPLKRVPPQAQEQRAFEVTCERLFGAKITNGTLQYGLLVLIGPLMRHAYQAVRAKWPPSKVHYFAEWKEGQDSTIAALLDPRDTVLLKASRGMRLERLIPAIEKRFGKAESPQPVE